MEKNDRANEGGSVSDSRGTSNGSERGRGNAANLSHEARVKGGQRSAQVQVRDEHGQFAGRRGGESKSRREESSGGGGGNMGQSGGGENSPRSDQSRNE